MKALNKHVSVLLIAACTILPAALSNAAPSTGGSDGGGGFQYPNAKLLLKVVSEPLAKSVEAMDDKAFQNFPSHLRRIELAQIIRTVVSKPEEHKERENASGELEGLMFDYDRNYCDEKGCGPRIIALKPFFDAYKGLPVAQLEKQWTKEKIYLLTLEDVRQRLVHEAAHLLNIGTTAKTDSDADVFYERLMKAAKSQFIFCQASDWATYYARDNKSYDVYEAFLIQMQTGKIKLVQNDPRESMSRAQAKVSVLNKLNSEVQNSNGTRDFNFDPYSSLDEIQYSLKDGILTWERSEVSLPNQKSRLKRT